MKRLLFFLILVFALSCEKQTIMRTEENFRSARIMSIDEAQKEVELIVSNMPSVKSATSWRNRTVSSRWKTNMKSKTGNDGRF